MKNGKTYCGAYSALGCAFEYFNDDCGYEQWSQYLIEKLRCCGAGLRGVDIGCGNGYFTRALCKAGYCVTGADVSPQMLNVAVELAAKQGVKADFILQDITKLNLNFKPDFATAVNDCINYVSQNRLRTAFAKVYKSLNKGGVFIFDVSTEHKLRHIVGDNVFARDYDDATCLWFNTLKDDRVEMEITVFTKRENGSYTRADEIQTQYIHKKQDITDALISCGFEVYTEGHLGGDETERINFICKKA